MPVVSCNLSESELFQNTSLFSRLQPGFPGKQNLKKTLIELIFIVCKERKEEEYHPREGRIRATASQRNTTGCLIKWEHLWNGCMGLNNLLEDTEEE